ncbi:BatD family protein [Lewinella sp. W8]|uniref:BatD family protein n=1 Tax=Lewinella sp. W8 TaxID=2528208 RepID=UPI00106893F4|nr:BatD family protein [Lewinella sp. W8]MTB50676.1 hypothetical protein [Lewinella sp. W8]
MTRTIWTKLAFLVLLCTCGDALLNAQHQDISFVAKVDKSRTLENSTVEFSLTLNNAQGADLKAPAFNDFIVLSGPNRLMGTSIVNGVGSSYLTFNWLLQPKRTGELTIESASIRASGRTYRTNSKKVTVLPADSEAGALAPENFLRAELSTTTAFVGQQVILDLNLYSSTNVISRNLMKEPDFSGFYARPRRQYDGRPRPVIENGREYQKRTLGSLALFPTKSGRIMIEPYRMVLGTVRYRSNSSFSRRFTEQVPLNTDTLYIDVSELPSPRPDDFSGGVGSYKLQVQADRDQMTTDDALTLRMAITGEGDIERIESFPPVSEDDWDIYDPVILQEEFLDSPTGMLGRKIFEYKVVPKRGGTFTIKPGLSYFNVDSAAYVLEAPTEFTVAVTGGTGTPTYDIDTSAVEVPAITLLSVTELPRGRRYGSDLTGKSWFWLLLLLPVVLSGGAIGWDRYRQLQENRDPVEVARERAAAMARQHLKEAKKYQEQVAARSFYDAIENALQGYLRDKLNLPASDLSRRVIGEKLREAGAESGLIERYNQLLQRCEMALYAGQDKADDLAETYQMARSVITDTEKELRG